MANRSQWRQGAQSPAVVVFNRIVAPTVVVATLLALMQSYWGKIGEEVILLATVAFLVSSQAFAQFNLVRLPGTGHYGIDLRKLLMAWGMIIGALLLLGFATKMSGAFSRRVLLTWMVITPVALFIAQLLFAIVMRKSKLGRRQRRAAIVGAGELGRELAARMGRENAVPITVSGFFDDRSLDRLSPTLRPLLTGTMQQLPDYVRENKIQCIYITLPMAAQPRTMRLLDELQDTTASIYFVPDIGRFSLVQTHLDEVADMPVIAVSDTPFTGANALVKRSFDLCAALILLILTAPLMLAIALGVRLSSPGPIIFRQHRYGLDGEQILVYKFRSMTVCEDGALIKQARKTDARVTPLGRFLRRTSLDELPQLFNVLRGSMSLVGPRPHAVAHNEMYRKLIKGYMLRHKVRPGITGWAQIHGLRGETETVDKMAARVRYDIEYIRNWSVLMDLGIILRTVALVYRDQAAH